MHRPPAPSVIAGLDPATSASAPKGGAGVGSRTKSGNDGEGLPIGHCFGGLVELFFFERFHV